MSDKQFIIDVDAAVVAYNEKNTENKMTRRILAEKLGLTYQTLTNYKGGKIPAIVGQIKNIIEITGVDFDDLVKTK